MNLKMLLIWRNFTFFLKIHKRLENVPGRPIISNCETSTEKISKFLDFHIKSIMRNRGSYIKDSNDFKSKIKIIDIPNDALLVTANVVGLYPSIPHEVDLSALREALDKRTRKEIPDESLIKMTEFVLKNNFLSLIQMCINRFQVLVLGQNLHLLMRAFLWINFKLNF